MFIELTAPTARTADVRRQGATAAGQTHGDWWITVWRHATCYAEALSPPPSNVKSRDRLASAGAASNLLLTSCSSRRPSGNHSWHRLPVLRSSERFGMRPGAVARIHGNRASGCRLAQGLAELHDPGREGGPQRSSTSAHRARRAARNGQGGESTRTCSSSSAASAEKPNRPTPRSPQQQPTAIRSRAGGLGVHPQRRRLTS